MTTRLDAVNACLAIMGEAPLNSLTEDHAFKEAALKYLDDNDRAIQSKGWWYNTESLTLMVNPQDFRIYLPGDGGTWVTGQDNPNGYTRQRLVQRGRVIYDLKEGTDRFPAGLTIKGSLVRVIPLEDCPESIGQYIERKTVLDFQNQYDGDQTKTRNLLIEVYGNGTNILGLLGQANAEHIRNTAMNFITENPRLARIRSRVNMIR